MDRRGDERQIASTIQRLAEPYADDCWTDTMGNLIVHKKGSGPKVMFAAHGLHRLNRHPH